MNKYNIFACLIATCLLLISCEKRPVGSQASPVSIHTSIAKQSLSTKKIILDTSFPDEATYGIFVCEHGSTSVAYKPNLWNIKAEYDSDVPLWQYYYVINTSTGDTSTSGVEDVSLVVRSPNVTADFYAYSPRTRTARDPEHIPFTIVPDTYYYPQEDLMYAEENLATYNDETPGVQDGNEGLDPESVSPLSATFSFRHAYALIVFNIQNLYSGSTFYLSDLTATLKDGATTSRLYRSGTFNSIQGTFNDDLVSVSSLCLGPYYEYRSGPRVPVLMVPTDVADDEIVFNFNVQGITLQPFVLKRAYVQHYDELGNPTGEYGFKSGYKYTFNFTLDNYIHFDGFTIETWDASEDVWSEQI